MNFAIRHASNSSLFMALPQPAHTSCCTKEEEGEDEILVESFFSALFSSSSLIPSAWEAFLCRSRISFIICSCRALSRAFLSCFKFSSSSFPSRSLSLEEEEEDGLDPSPANAPVRCAMSLYVCTSIRHR